MNKTRKSKPKLINIIKLKKYLTRNGRKENITVNS